MYEEDRQTALALYSEMFEKTCNEQGLLQFFSSPTRQAVVVARAYGGRERKLDVNSQRRGGEDGNSNGIPDFVEAIAKVRVCAEAAGLFTAEEPAAEEATEEAPVEEVAEEAPAEEKVEEAPAEEVTEEAPAEEEAEEAPAEEEAEGAPAEEEAEEEPAEEEVEEAPAEEEAEEAPAEEEAEEEEEKEPSAEVQEFFANFSIANPECVEEEKAEEEAEEESAEGEDDIPEVETVRKVKVLALIGYLIVAIPLGIIGMLALLIAALVMLAAAAGAVIGGITLATTVSAGFGVFADLLVVAGAALIAVGLGVLFLWTAVWLIGGVCASLAKGLTSLGRKWCVKEVSAE